MVAKVVLLDTDVFSALYVTPRRSTEQQGDLVQGWQQALAGHRTVISFQTRAEILDGAYRAVWGDKRLAATRALLDATPTIYVDDEVVEARARLRAAATATGHPLGAPRDQEADRWVAACAIAKGIPLLTGNLKHFERAPGLVLHETPSVL